MIKAFIFDLDGTIIDTEKIGFEAYRQAFSAYDFELTLDVWGQYVGAVFTPERICQHAEEQTGKVINCEKVVKMGEEIFDELIKNEQPLPGVLDMLEAGKKLNFKIGLATNSNAKRAYRFLDSLEINDYFDNVYTVDHIKQPKPDPEIYLKSVQHFNLFPYEAIAFEDSVVGSLAAKQANLHTIVIPGALTKNDNFQHADLQIDSMDKINLDTLIPELNAINILAKTS